MHLVWYLAWVFLLTLLIRGLLSLGVRLMARRWPDVVGTLNEFERYGWWFSLIVGSLLAGTF